MDILNNREIALVFWLVILACILWLPKAVEIRTGLKSFLSAFFVKQIISVVCLMSLYIVVVVYGLAKLNLWNIEQLKNTFFWSMSVGLMSLFKLEKIKKDSNFFKDLVLDHFKLFVILQFVISIYTFSLWLELLLLPLLALSICVLIVAKTNKKYHQVEAVFEFGLSLYGLLVVGYTVYMLIVHFDEFGNKQTAYDFFVPALLTTFYLPFIFLMLTYTSYEEVFIRLKFIRKDKKLEYAAKFLALVLFNFRLNLLKRWSTYAERQNINTYSELLSSFRYILKFGHYEKNTKEVPRQYGWSPFKAKDFLINEGLSVDLNSTLFEGRWPASSSVMELNKEFIPDRIVYYIEGSEQIANVLKIKLYVNDAARSQQACRKLEEVAEILSFYSLAQSLSNDMSSAILNTEPYFEKIEGKAISLTAEYWENHKSNGYALNFSISNFY